PPPRADDLPRCSARGAPVGRARWLSRAADRLRLRLESARSIRISDKEPLMGAKPRDSKSAARTAIKRAPARRVPTRKAAAKPARGGGKKSVAGYVAALAGWRKQAAQRLRDVIRSAAPGCSESFKWGQPVYEDHGPFCYFRANADHLTFGFWRGEELDDPFGRLEGTGDRMRH